MHWIRAIPIIDSRQGNLLDWGVHLSRHVQVLAASFPDCFPPDQVAESKRDHFYGGLPKWLKAMVAYLKVGVQVRTYSDYLRATQEAEKEDSMELPWGPRTVSSPCRNSRATSLSWRHQLCIWRKRTPGPMKMKRAMIPAESKELPKNLWCIWQGL